ncbi:uncharacterized protein LOC114828893 isoform X2 [Esox lucius]|uniref:uncharacterized protein LOC114828893 isoform X2 n=1 Tax=Esox lucius TaxID=8010 RepID=UPI0014777C59|nr:uncharacterized protein LOC114828893 isoform X2 [Esox lucius]
MNSTSGFNSSSIPSTAMNSTSGFNSSSIPSTAMNSISGFTPSSIPSTAMKSTSGRQNSNHQERYFVKLLWLAAGGVASGLGLYLLGLTAFCLCRKSKNSSQRSVQQDDHNQVVDLVMGDMRSGGMVDSGNDGFYSVITSVPSTFLPSENSSQRSVQQDDHNQVVDLVMGDMRSGGMVDSGNDGFYSVITSVPSTFLPSGPIAEN